MKVIATLNVRYRNQNGSTGRPQKIRHMIDNNGKEFYCTMNMSHRIDPKDFEIVPRVVHFQTRIKKIRLPKEERKIKNTSEVTWEYIRVKFLKGENSYYRPRNIYKITDPVTGKVEYAPAGTKGTSKRIDSSLFITEWEHGPTPTPIPSRKYSKEQLKSFGYSDELIEKIYRNYSSKDVTMLIKKTGGVMSRNEAKILLDKYKHISKVEISDYMKEKIKERKRASIQIHKNRVQECIEKEIDPKTLCKEGSRRYHKLVKKIEVAKKNKGNNPLRGNTKKKKSKK